MSITHVELLPMGNLVSLRSCTREVTCGSDTVNLLEQMLSPFWKEVLVCCPFLDSCLGYKEDMSLKGREKSLLACRQGVLRQFWHPSVLSCDRSMDLCAHSGTCMCGGTRSLFSFHASVCNIKKQRFSVPLTDCFDRTKCVLLCPLQLHSLKGKCTYKSYIHLK